MVVVVTRVLLETVWNDPIIIPNGIRLLVTHFILYGIFKYGLPPGPWKVMPSFTAHQVIVVGLMIYQTMLGFQYYYHHNNKGSSVFDVNEGGIYMAQFCMSSMMLYDIPVTTFFMKDDGAQVDMLMHLHHVGFFFIAAIVMGIYSEGVHIGSEYAPFFFGIIELSSIPLAIVDCK